MGSVHSVMMFVENPITASQWYAALFSAPIVEFAPEFCGVQYGDVEICFHLADEKTSPSRHGQFAYWRVDSIDDMLARAVASGAERHRGPIPMDDVLWICQIADPFGNVLALCGPKNNAAAQE